MKNVIIVGAGVIGLFAALRLAKAGARVTLLDGEADDFTPYGPASSAAAAGMLAPLGEPSPHTKLQLASYDLWREQSPGALWADGVRFAGGVIVASNADAATRIAADCERFGRPAASLSAGEFRRRTGLQARVNNALFVADEGIADPLRVLGGLAMDARQHGVQIKWRQDVASVTGTSVTTQEGGVFDADAVVLAPGAWANAALIAAAPALAHVQPGKGHLVAVKLERALNPNLHFGDLYLCERISEVVLGATLELGRFDRHIEQARVDMLLAQAEAIFPSGIKPTGRAWAGIRPMSPDGAPIIGPTGPDKIIVAAGHSRNGWLYAPITAEIIRAYVFGDAIAPEWAALSPQRFESKIES